MRAVYFGAPGHDVVGFGANQRTKKIRIPPAQICQSVGANALPLTAVIPVWRASSCFCVSHFSANVAYTYIVS